MAEDTIRTQALNLALMYHRQQDQYMVDDDVLKTAKKFLDFLSNKTLVEEQSSELQHLDSCPFVGQPFKWSDACGCNTEPGVLPDDEFGIRPDGRYFKR